MLPDGIVAIILCFLQMQRYSEAEKSDGHHVSRRCPSAPFLYNIEVYGHFAQRLVDGQLVLHLVDESRQVAYLPQLPPVVRYVGAVQQEVAEFRHERVERATGAYLGLHLARLRVDDVAIARHEPRRVAQPLLRVGRDFQLTADILVSEGLVGGNLQREPLAVADAAGRTVVIELVAYLVDRVAGQRILAADGAPLVVAKSVVVVATPSDRGQRGRWTARC